MAPLEVGRWARGNHLPRFAILVLSSRAPATSTAVCLGTYLRDCHSSSLWAWTRERPAGTDVSITISLGVDRVNAVPTANFKPKPATKQILTLFCLNHKPTISSPGLWSVMHSRHAPEATAFSAQDLDRVACRCFCACCIQALHQLCTQTNKV